MRPCIRSYGTLCELGIFRGYHGLEEVYELDGLLYGVSEEAGPWGGPHFSVHRWAGAPANLHPAEPAAEAA